jgi:hypothetical protein
MLFSYWRQGQPRYGFSGLAKVLKISINGESAVLTMIER